MNSDTQSFELALLVLNLDKNSFSKMKRSELVQYLEQNLKTIDPNNKRKTLVASKIVLQYKRPDSTIRPEISSEMKSEMKPEMQQMQSEMQQMQQMQQMQSEMQQMQQMQSEMQQMKQMKQMQQMQQMQQMNKMKIPPNAGAYIPTEVGCVNNGPIDQYACPLREYNPFGPCNKCNCGNDTRFPCNLINDRNSLDEDDVAGYNIGFDDKYNYNNLLKFRTRTFEEALITPNDSDAIYEKGGYPKLNDETFNPKISRLQQPLLTLGIYRLGYKNDKSIMSEDKSRENFTTFTSSYNSVYVNNNGTGYIKEDSMKQQDNQPIIEKHLERRIENNKII